MRLIVISVFLYVTVWINSHRHSHASPLVHTNGTLAPYLGMSTPHSKMSTSYLGMSTPYSEISTPYSNISYMNNMTSSLSNIQTTNSKSVDGVTLPPQLFPAHVNVLNVTEVRFTNVTNDLKNSSDVTKVILDMTTYANNVSNGNVTNELGNGTISLSNVTNDLRNSRNVTQNIMKLMNNGNNTVAPITGNVTVVK